jgi:adenosine deaminase
MPPLPAKFYRSLPKVELHRHLEGSLRLSTLLEVSREVDLNISDLDLLRPLVQVDQADPRTSENFLSKFEVLRKFYRSREIIRRITGEAIADAAADNVRYLELRFTPSTLAKAGDYPLGEVIDWVSTAALSAQSKYEITTRLIASVNRHESVDLAAQVAQLAIERLDSQAGEWGPAENVAQAIDLFAAERIGHGVRVMEDPQITAMARERGTTFEVCLTSNYQSGVVNGLDDHPIQEMIQAGLNPTINTDDPGISQITLGSEYELVCEQLRVNLAALQDRVIAAAQAAFLPEDEHEKLAKALEGEFQELISATKN